MLTLSLLRHAKSSWKIPMLPDHDRPLAARGETDAPLMGKTMTERGIDPDLVLCSSARRTRDTLALVLPELKIEPKVVYEDALYHATPAEMLDMLRQVAPGASRVMVVGHMDEIGFMVKEITKDGYIKFLPLGGWWGHVALGQRMRIITSQGPVLGIVGSKPPHMLSATEREKVLDIKAMFIDVGVQAKFDVKKKLGIKVGDPIIPDSDFTIMGNKQVYCSKAFDNRSACAAVYTPAQIGGRSCARVVQENEATRTRKSAATADRIYIRIGYTSSRRNRFPLPGSGRLQHRVTDVLRPKCIAEIGLGGFAGELGGFPDSGANSPPWRLYLRSGDLADPGPGGTAVFLENREDSVGGGAFGINMNGWPDQPKLTRWQQNLPASYHHRAGGLSYADGHSEIHRWTDPRTMPPINKKGRFVSDAAFWAGAQNSPNNRDITWIQERATRRIAP
jgi:phosphohistidine phosphatase SixA